jgi:hypothetical protein
LALVLGDEEILKVGIGVALIRNIFAFYLIRTAIFGCMRRILGGLIYRVFHFSINLGSQYWDFNS